MPPQPVSPPKALAAGALRGPREVAPSATHNVQYVHASRASWTARYNLLHLHKALHFLHRCVESAFNPSCPRTGLRNLPKQRLDPEELREGIVQIHVAQIRNLARHRDARPDQRERDRNQQFGLEALAGRATKHRIGFSNAREHGR